MLVHDIGRAIEAARKRLDLSLEDLAASTLLSSGLLSSVERGEALISTAKLDRIASALGIDAFALYGGREVERALVVLPRYVARSDFRQEDLPVLRRALERATVLRDVSALLRRRSLAADFEPRPVGANAAFDGYECARRVRKALEQITEPLGSLPTLLAERFDVPVVTESLSTSALQAAAVRSSVTRAAAVVLNEAAKDAPPTGSYQAWLVDRVSICHELCHVVFDEPKGGIVDVVLDDLATEGHDKTPIEQRARAFAAEMLIPLHGLRQLFGEEGRQTDRLVQADSMVDRVRAQFKTPAEIAVNHLYNHGYVARIDSFRKDLIQSAQKRELSALEGSPPDERDAWNRVLSARLQEAHEGCHITEGAVRALLEIPAGEPLPWDRAGT